jgi:lipopolysaccharide/colanic/teichoic acid biosynthesis glycosyltransferase
MISHATLQFPSSQGSSSNPSRSWRAPRIETPRYTSTYSLAQARLQRGEPIVDAEGNLDRRYQIAKRALDIIGAAALLAILSPVLITVYLILLVTTRGKPLIRQERVGHLGRRFGMYKFRSMRLDAEKLQHLVQNQHQGPIFKNRHDPRITRVGRILRRTSIDEMPQLFNVLLGQMSLVGPRPPLAKEVAQYKAWQRRRLAVRPGLTCLWQVSGRSEIGFEHWVRLDLWYLRHQSLSTDLKLLVRTPLCVLSCRGAY